jgi:adenosylcobinamide-phosphate synthase
MDILLNIITHPALEPWLILCAVVCFERIWPLPTRVDPMSFVRFLGERMASRVKPKTSAPNSQHAISGTLAAFMIIAPNLVILIIFREFVYYPALFDACILYICLQFSSHLQRSQQIRKAQILEKKSLSKSLLAPMVLRETDMLSEVGVTKATVEGLLLRFHYQSIVTWFWFILLGPFTALTYRVCYELHHSWNTKLPQYEYFGKAVATFVFILQWLPIRLSAFISIFIARGVRIVTYIRQHRIARSISETQGAIVLRACHYALDINLSGPLFYRNTKHSDANKYRRTKYIGKGEPREIVISNTIALINRISVVFLLLLLLFCLALHTAINY